MAPFPLSVTPIEELTFAQAAIKAAKAALATVSTVVEATEKEPKSVGELIGLVTDAVRSEVPDVVEDSLWERHVSARLCPAPLWKGGKLYCEVGLCSLDSESFPFGCGGEIVVGRLVREALLAYGPIECEGTFYKVSNRVDTAEGHAQYAADYMAAVNRLTGLPLEAIKAWACAPAPDGDDTPLEMEGATGTGYDVVVLPRKDTIQGDNGAPAPSGWVGPLGPNMGNGGGDYIIGQGC